MTDPNAPDNPDLTDDRFTDMRLTTPRLVELLRDDQRRRWQAGRPVPVAQYLDRFPQVCADSTLALDLIWSEYLIREDLGDKPTLEEYAREFPQYESLLARQHKVHMWVDQAGTTTTFSKTSPVLRPRTSCAHGSGREGCLARYRAVARLRDFRRGGPRRDGCRLPRPSLTPREGGRLENDSRPLSVRALPLQAGVSLAGGRLP